MTVYASRRKSSGRSLSAACDRRGFSDLSSNSFGLTVALGIAEKHDGTILLESNEWGGTTFHVVLSTVLPETNLFRAPKVPYGHAQEDPIRIYLSDQMPKQEL